VGRSSAFAGRAGMPDLAGTGRERIGRMRVLYVTNQLPFPSYSGGQLREAQLLSRVAGAVDIELVILTGHYERDLAHAELALPYCSGLRLFESVPAPSGGPPDDVPERVWSYRSQAFDEWLGRHACGTEADVVHVEGYFLAGHLPADRTVPLMVVEENVEYLLDREREATGRKRGARWQVSRELEHDIWSVATLLAAVSEQDVDVIRHDIPGAEVALTPNGFDHLPATGPRVHTGTGCRVAFVGNYGWAPTADGAWDLVTSIWPRIYRAMPSARLALVGADLPGDLAAAARAAGGIDIVGEVPSVLPTLTGADVFVCPVRTGSGVKVKMVEAMRAGCAIVCTNAAVRGLPDGAASAVVMADDEHEFADAVVGLLRDAVRRDTLSRRAVELIHQLPTWDEAAKALIGSWQRTAALPAGF
jgi:glycosyltransferase involved in cell wall biosynthesis